MLCQGEFSSLNWLTVSQGGHLAAKTSAGLQDRRVPPALATPSSEMSAKCYSRELAAPCPAGKMEPGFSSWIKKATPHPHTPQKRGCDKLQSPGNLSVHCSCWQGKRAYQRGSPQRNVCQEPTAIYQAVSGGGRWEHCLLS